MGKKAEIFNDLQTLVMYKNVRVQRRHKNIFTHVIRSPMVPIFCGLELPQSNYYSI